MAPGLVSPNPSIRRLDVRRDLLAAADLIEHAFSPWLDEDGWDYLRQVRRAAVSGLAQPTGMGYRERITTPLFGYIWEENGQVVGNLSLIPVVNQGSFIYMIANVAVDPAFQGRGIGTALTRAGLEHIRRLGLPAAWLQVREDNFPARELYRKTGFAERALRSTWVRKRGSPLLTSSPIIIQPRPPAEWQEARTWLERTYPREVTWNLPFQISRIAPTWWNRLSSWFSGSEIRHFSARSPQDGSLLAVLALEPARDGAQNAWLGVSPDHPLADEAIRALLNQPVLTASAVRVNYPAGEAVSAFEKANFKLQHTLRWMEHRFPAQLPD